MDSSIFFGGSLIAAVVAGGIALFAPCCISVMLPAYFAGSFQHRRMLVAMTVVFAAGIATVVLPIALGAAVVRRVLIGEHTTIYLVGGVFMLALAVHLLLGGQLKLPMPGRRAGTPTGPLGVYGLGVFSGIASSCCAPVLAGVIALSGISSSLVGAAGLGLGFVFGMVAPLFVISLLWDRYDLKDGGLFRPRSFTWRLGPVSRTISGTSLASAVLLAVMGATALWIAAAGEAMPEASGWQAAFSVRLQRWGRTIVEALDWIPTWASIALFVVVLTLIARVAARQLGWRAGVSSTEHCEADGGHATAATTDFENTSVSTTSKENTGA